MLTKYIHMNCVCVCCAQRREICLIARLLDMLLIPLAEVCIQNSILCMWNVSKDVISTWQHLETLMT